MKDWDYKLAYFKSDNEWAIMRKKDDEVQWLSPENVWTKNKSWAKRYFHEDVAMSALIVAKRKCLEEEKPYRPEVAAGSWGELLSR